MSSRTISRQYAEAAESFIEFARTLTDEEWATRCPCTPAWSVRDVLSHVSGVCDDGLAGRTDGAGTDAWTAAQVERNAACSVDELLDRWAAQCELFGSAIEALDEGRPPFDCHTHEHDVRHALGRPGNRESAIIGDAAAGFGVTLDQPAIALSIDVGAGPIRRTDGRDAPDTVGLTTTPFEIFRSRLGRRSRAQVRSYDWTGDDDAIDAVIDHWFIFGPSDVPIIE